MSVQHIALVLEASGLKPQEKAVLTAFCNHTDPSGKTFAGEQRLMREAGMSRSTFQEWRARLVERELLISKRKGRKGGGRTTSDTWVNLAALRAARDPFFAREDTDRPEDENPFSQVKGNGPEARAEGGAMARRRGPKGGGNGPEARAINGPEARATQARRPGPDPSVIPQGESLSGDSSVAPDASVSVEVVSDEREAAAPDNDGPVVVPSPSSAAGRGSSEGDAPARAAELLVSDLPGRLGRASVRRLAPLAAAALADGYTPETLRAELGELVDVSRINNRAALPGLYERALGDLPPAPAACSKSAGVPRRRSVVPDEYAL